MSSLEGTAEKPNSPLCRIGNNQVSSKTQATKANLIFIIVDLERTSLKILLDI
jgi:hypothetical protein